MKPVRSSYQDFRPNYIVPKRTLFQKYPRVIIISAISSFLLALFSRPIYDIFINDYAELPKVPQLPPNDDE